MLSMVEMFAGGVASGDFDKDGLVDLFIVRGDIGPNLLYRNLGNNKFIDIADDAGVAYTKSLTENYRHSGPTFADLDGDGDLDIFVGGIYGDPSLVYQNNGDSTFSNVTEGSGIDTLNSTHNISSAFGDYDLDGDLDLFITHWGTPRSIDGIEDTEHLWRNNSGENGIKFTSVSLESRIAESIISDKPFQSAYGVGFDYSFTPSFVKLNEDDYPDLVVASDFRTSRVYINNTDGTFTDITDENVNIDRNAMGGSVGDYDNDGDNDWFVSAIYNEPQNGTHLFPIGNRLYQNNNGSFIDVTEEASIKSGGWGWGSCFVDLDNDGYLDIYHTNGWGKEEFINDTSRYFESNGKGGFIEKAEDAGLYEEYNGRGVVCADFDNDGDIDIFLLHDSAENAATFYTNNYADSNFLRVKLNGLIPNLYASGARIYATSNEMTQMREVIIGSNFTSQNLTVQIFGLGSSTSVDKLRVKWPDGKESIQLNVPVNQTLVIEHPDN